MTTYIEEKLYVLVYADVLSESLRAAGVEPTRHIQPIYALDWREAYGKAVVWLRGKDKQHLYVKAYPSGLVSGKEYYRPTKLVVRQNA